MKKIILILFALATLNACKKKEEIDMKARLNGDWNIQKLDFSANVPFDGLIVPIIGSVDQVGEVKIDAINLIGGYTIGFKPRIILPNGDEPFDTIAFVGSGPVDIALEQVSITDSATNEVYNFRVLTNEELRQVWEINVPFEIDSVNSTTVKLILNMNKK